MADRRSRGRCRMLRFAEHSGRSAVSHCCRGCTNGRLYEGTDSVEHIYRGDSERQLLSAVRSGTGIGASQSGGK